MEYTVLVYVERAGVLSSLVKRNTHLEEIRGVFEVLSDPAPSTAFHDVPLTRPARVGVETVVQSVFGYAALRTAATSHHLLVVRCRVHPDRWVAIYQYITGWDGGGMRQGFTRASG